MIVSEKIAAYSLLIILSLVVLFHAAAMAGLVPIDIIWGGRIQNRSQMFFFEGISIAINLMMILVVSSHANLLKLKMGRTVTTVALWIMFCLFFVNTVGNLQAINKMERIIFTPLTFLLSLLCLRLAVSREKPMSRPE